MLGLVFQKQFFWQEQLAVRCLFFVCREMHAANILTNSGFETANLAGWATFGPDNYSQSGAGVAPGGINYYFINPLL
jgi:hypothetical protein